MAAKVNLYPYNRYAGENPYDRFVTDFQDLIKTGKSKEADELLNQNKDVYARIFSSQRPFDAMFEFILEDPKIAKPAVRIVQLATILENHNLDSDLSRLYKLAGLIEVNNSYDAREFLTKYPGLSTIAKDYPENKWMTLVINFDSQK